MQIIDAHHHLWDLERHDYPWLKPETAHPAGDLTPICRSYRLDDFLADAAGLDLVKSVHLQAAMVDPVAETAWLQALADDPAGRGFPHAIVAFADLADPKVEAVLERHREHPNVRGIRFMVNYMADDPLYCMTDRGDWLRDAQWRRGYALLEKHQLSFDLQVYHHQMADAAALAGRRVDAVFAPSVEEMYPEGFATTVTLAGPAEGLESDFRPHFFGGVATVVAKLLIACAPDRAIFGEKDYQQLLVIRRLVADLGLPVEIVGHPTVRDTDGLALSSRNAYLSPGDRQTAPLLYKALNRAAAAIRAGAPPHRVVSACANDLGVAGFKVDYVELRNADTLAPVADVRREPLRLLAAARLGTTRLIDNIPV